MKNYYYSHNTCLTSPVLNVLPTRRRSSLCNVASGNNHPRQTQSYLLSYKTGFNRIPSTTNIRPEDTNRPLGAKASYLPRIRVADSTL